MKKNFLLGSLLLLVLLCALTSCEHEHKWSEWVQVKEASCTEGNLQERHCDCGEIESRSTSVATGHTFGAWTIVEEATCTENGAQECVCACGEKQTKTIPKDDHAWENATCTTAKTCAICGLTEGAPLNHTYKTGVCSACNSVDPEARTTQMELLETIADFLPELESACSQVTEIYERAWYFYVKKAESYSSYDNILADFSKYIGIKQEYINNATIQYLTEIGAETTRLNGLAALRILDGVLTITETAIELSGLFDLMQNAVDSFMGVVPQLHGFVIGMDVGQALSDYGNAVINYYNFAKCPTGSYISYVEDNEAYEILLANTRKAFFEALRNAR